MMTRAKSRKTMTTQGYENALWRYYRVKQVVTSTVALMLTEHVTFTSIHTAAEGKYACGHCLFQLLAERCGAAHQPDHQNAGALI